MSTELTMVPEIKRHQVPEGAENPHGTWRFSHQNDRLDSEDKILDLIGCRPAGRFLGSV